MSKERTIAAGSFISQKESVMLQGVAVSLMVWHHLFGFPERVSVPYVLTFDAFFHIETIASYFGRICIAVFAFCSGYGMEKKSNYAGNAGIRGILENYKSAVRHLFKFFLRFWLVCIAFLPFGFITNKYPIRFETIAKSILGQSYRYNAEWWYIGHYIKFMLLFPVISALGQWLGEKWKILPHIGMLAAVAVMVLVPKDTAWMGFYGVLIYFIEGMYFARSVWFEKMAQVIRKNWLRLLVGLMLIGAVFELRVLGIEDWMSVSFFVFGFVLLFKNPIMDKRFGKVFLAIGKYSTYIWLTHTFFAYYYFQPFTYAPKYSWLIAIWCILLCMFSGAVLEKVRLLLSAAVSKTETTQSKIYKN